MSTMLYAFQKLRSPDGRLKVIIQEGNPLTYAVVLNERPLIWPLPTGLQFEGKKTAFQGRFARLTATL